MAGANLPISLLVIGGGIVLVWTGITDPENGIVGEIGRVLRGEERKDAFARKSSAPSASDLASAILAYDSGGGASGSGGAVPANYSANSIVGVARQAIGTPYVWGGGNGNGPTGGGFDCSGLAQFAYKKGAGIDIPRVTGAQQAQSKRLSESEARAGDLVFWGMPAYHCGIYLGGGKMIHAPHTGALVREDAVSSVTPGPVTYGRYTKKPEVAAA